MRPRCHLRDIIRYIHGCSCNMHRRTRCRATLSEGTGTGSIFRPVPAAVVATALNRNTGRAHPVCARLTRAVETH